MSCIKQRRVLQVVLPTLFILSLLSIDLNYMELIFYISQFINRKAMFLFCNAILLFIVRDSGLLAPSVVDLYDEFVAKKGSDMRLRIADEAESKASVVVEEKVVVEIVRPLEMVVIEEEREELGVAEETEEDLGVDELNKRCEEFIEKVKRERKMEAIQLNMVDGNEVESLV